MAEPVKKDSHAAYLAAIPIMDHVANEPNLSPATESLVRWWLVEFIGARHPLAGIRDDPPTEIVESCQQD
jgi:hypothetical protein